VRAGLRPAEIWGLRWDDVNFEAGTVWPKRHVVSRYPRWAGGLQVCQTKTELSAAAVPVMPAVLRMLEAYHVTCPVTRPGAWVSLRSNLSDYSARSGTALACPLCASTICATRGPASLRVGTDLFTVSWEMHHADIRTTSVTYLEPDEELGRNGVTALDQMVGFQPSLPSGTKIWCRQPASISYLQVSRRGRVPCPTEALTFWRPHAAVTMTTSENLGATLWPADR
jgi:hypothetical protein